MGKKKFVTILMALALVFSAFVLVMNQKELSAEECRLIRVYGEPGGQITFGLEPPIVNIRSGACLVWVNLARDQEIKVIFEEGKVCKDVTTAPVGFQRDAKNCYVTNYIPFGATSSLLFEKEGTYDYIALAGKTRVKGKVIVRMPSK